MKFIFSLFLITNYTLIHDSWISSQSLTDPKSGEWCCGAIDCFETEVLETNYGYVIKETGEIIEANRIIWKSPDNKWIRCRYLNGPKSNKTRCLIGPIRGS